MAIDQLGGPERLLSLETERKPHYRFMVTRHADRLPSGELTPEGVAKAQEKGLKLGGEAEVVKGYGSDDSTERAFKTAKAISEESGTVSPDTGESYATRKVADIQYDVLNPDMAGVLKESSKMVDRKTLEELGLPLDTDLKALPKEEQARIAPVRAKNQEHAFTYIITQKPEAVRRLAMGLAHQLVHEMAIAKRYTGLREFYDKPEQKDVVLNTTTHGIFSEALFKLVGEVKNPDGSVTEGIEDFKAIGGYFQPTESYHLDVEDPKALPDKIPVVFDSEDRPQGTVFIDRQKLEQLATDYEAWKKEQAETEQGKTE